MGMIKEFKTFAMQGNMVDLAVGVIIGGAFGKIISSLVDDILMPPIGMALGGMNFSSLAIKLNDTVSLKYGAFLQSCIDFLIIAFCIFMLIKAINKFKAKESVAPPAPSQSEIYLKEIRDSLKK